MFARLFHSQYRKLVSASHDQQLLPGQQELLEKHLERCQDCRQFQEELKKVSGLLKTWQDQPVTGDLEQKIRKDFLSDKYKGGYVMNTRRALQTATALVGVLVITVLSSQVYLHRGVKGKVRSSAESIGEQYNLKSISEQFNREYAPGQTRSQAKQYKGGEYSEVRKKGGSTGYMGKSGPVNMRYAAINAVDGAQTVSLGQTSQYEPYYTQSSLQSVMSAGTSFGVVDQVGDMRLANNKAAPKDYRERDEGLKAYVPVASPKPIEANGTIIIHDVTIPATGNEEKVIRSADIGVEVADVQKSYDAVKSIAADKGGYLATADFQEEKGVDGVTQKTSARLTLRVPRAKLEETLDALRALGQVRDFNIQSSDVSREYSQVLTEFNTTKVIYDKLRKKFEARGNTVDEAIQWESELTPYEKKLEALKTRMTELDNLIAMSTVNVQLFTAVWRYESALNIEVDDLAKTYEAITKLAQDDQANIVRGGYAQVTAGRAQASTALRLSLDKVVTLTDSLKKLGKVTNFQVISANLPEGCSLKDASGKACPKNGSAILNVNFYVPAWKVAWRSSKDTAHERLMESLAGMISWLVDHMAAIIVVMLVLAAGYFAGLGIAGAIRNRQQGPKE